MAVEVNYIMIGTLSIFAIMLTIILCVL